MNNFKLTRDTLIGDKVCPKGDVVQAEGRFATLLVKSGAANPIEQASAEPKAERATSPRQR